MKDKDNKHQSEIKPTDEVVLGGEFRDLLSVEDCTLFRIKAIEESIARAYDTPLLQALKRAKNKGCVYVLDTFDYLCEEEKKQYTPEKGWIDESWIKVPVAKGSAEKKVEEEWKSNGHCYILYGEDAIKKSEVAFYDSYKAKIYTQDCETYYYTHDKKEGSKATIAIDINKSLEQYKKTKIKKNLACYMYAKYLSKIQKENDIDFVYLENGRDTLLYNFFWIEDIDILDDEKTKVKGKSLGELEL